MAESSFAIREALSYGWAKVKDNLGVFVPLGLLSWVCAALQGGVNSLHDGAAVLRWFLSPLLLLVSSQLAIGWIRAALSVYRGRPARLSELLHVDLELLFNYIICSLLCGFVVVCGLILLIVPGVLWAAKYCFAGFLVVDKNADPLSAMRRSAELTRPVRGQLILFGLALIGVNLLGAMALGIGLLLTLPVSLMAMFRVYNQILQRTDSRGQPRGETALAA